jgi:hypothetical protein
MCFTADGNVAKTFLATTQVNGRGRWVHIGSHKNVLDDACKACRLLSCHCQHPKSHWLPSVPCSVAEAIGGGAAVVRENIQLRRASR